MATNKPYDDSRHIGVVPNCSQTLNPKTEQWVKKDIATGKFIDVKQNDSPFKGGGKEK